jgi:hypothetical protein
MSKRCELQKMYYQANGNYKGNGKYSDDYVMWLENEVLALRIHNVVSQSEQLLAFFEHIQREYNIEADITFGEALQSFKSK